MNPIRAQLLASGIIQKPLHPLDKSPVRACAERIKNMDTNKAKTYKALAILNAAAFRAAASAR